MTKDMNDCFAENLRKLRKLKKVGLMELSKISYINHSTLSQYERRLIKTIPDSAKKNIADFFKIPIEWFYTSGDERQQLFISEIDRLSMTAMPDSLEKAEEMTTIKLEESVTDEERALFLSMLSKVKIRRSDYIGAIEVCNKILDFKNIDLSSIFFSAYFNMCLAYYYTKDYKSVLKHVEHIKSDDDKDYDVARLLHLSACAAIEIGDSTRAIKDFGVALKIYKKLNKKSGVRQIIHNFGNIHELRGELDAAKDYYKQSYEIAITFEDDKHSLFESLDYCKISLFLGLYDECKAAMDVLKESYPCHPAYDSLYWYINAMLSDDIDYRKKLLVDRIDKLNEWDRGGYHDLKRYIAIELARIYTNEGDHLQAIEYYNIAKEASDKIIERHKRRSIK